MLLLFLAFFFQSFCPGTIEIGWKGIKSLKSDRVSVEKILGKPTIIGDPEKIGHAFNNYETEEASVQINYSTAPCKKNWGGRGDYDVPENTVLAYNMSPKQSIKLDDLKYARDKYTKIDKRQEFAGLVDVYFDFQYINEDDGVTILTKLKDGVEYLYLVSYEPRIKNINYRECKSKINFEIENGWEGIKILQTDKAEVEKILGKSSDSSAYSDYYRTEEANIRVIYSTEPCRKNDLGRGDYDVPKNTVLKIELLINKALKLADFKFSRQKYRVTDPEISPTYRNEDDGIVFYTKKRDVCFLYKEKRCI